MSEHPEWLAVGREVVAEQRLGRSVAWRREGTVTSHTKTQVVVQYANGGGARFRRKSDGWYVEVPKYLDYTTALRAKYPETQASPPGAVNTGRALDPLEGVDPVEKTTHEHSHVTEVREPEKQPPPGYRVLGCECGHQHAFDEDGYPEDTRLPNPFFRT